jgi:hypothetical protein
VHSFWRKNGWATVLRAVRALHAGRVVKHAAARAADASVRKPTTLKSRHAGNKSLFDRRILSLLSLIITECHDFF